MLQPRSRDEPGSAILTDSLSTTVDIDAVEDGYTTGLDLSGTAEPGEAEADFKLDLNGTLTYDTYSYAGTTDWDCSATETEIERSGTTTADSYVLDTTVVFEK